MFWSYDFIDFKRKTKFIYTMKSQTYYYFAETHRSRPHPGTIRIFETEEQLIKYAVKIVEEEIFPDYLRITTKENLIKSNFSCAYNGIYGGFVNDKKGLQKIKDFTQKIVKNLTVQS